MDRADETFEQPIGFRRHCRWQHRAEDARSTECAHRGIGDDVAGRGQEFVIVVRFVLQLGLARDEGAAPIRRGYRHGAHADGTRLRLRDGRRQHRLEQERGLDGRRAHNAATACQRDGDGSTCAQHKMTT
ncbi:MAG: hypothetical protein ABIO63_01960 [Casimicrobiaceae bacterium]